MNGDKKSTKFYDASCPCCRMDKKGRAKREWYKKYKRYLDKIYRDID